jgi:secretion/DNA translocation related TadE-like protein
VPGRSGEWRSGDRQRGSGTVLMVVVVAMAGFLITVTLLLGSAIVARHRAGAIADLAALAAAGVPPGPQACERALRVVDRNAGRLTGCRILGDGSVLVKVELEVGGRPGPAQGSARAGPAQRSG